MALKSTHITESRITSDEWNQMLSTTFSSLITIKKQFLGHAVNSLWCIATLWHQTPLWTSVYVMVCWLFSVKAFVGFNSVYCNWNSMKQLNLGKHRRYRRNAIKCCQLIGDTPMCYLFNITYKPRAKLRTCYIRWLLVDCIHSMQLIHWAFTLEKLIDQAIIWRASRLQGKLPITELLNSCVPFTDAVDIGL